ncbi:MerR family transcriptional regulator [Ureibacillus massiliensis]|uniref:MerR family transcriptional regulator n=1 Tax=Ureibacillus massiliensis TaxID=292806 RepID=UPI00068AB2F3|nr:MerR family transcriptional regulator [Ureibacillus massiliensis]RKJ59861.1 MerR family transcriptional regulator [Butyricicoccus sp. 1XD8-22]
MDDLLELKIITIGNVSNVTGLSERQIRYYEEKQLIFPKKSSKGTRTYSIKDLETLLEISNGISEGLQTKEIRERLNDTSSKKKSNNRNGNENNRK